MTKRIPKTLSVLLLDAGGHHSQRVAICLGQIPGLKLHVVSNEAWVGIRFSRHVTSFQAYPPAATEAEQLDFILKAIKQTRSEVLLPVVDSSSRFMAAHRAALDRHIALAPIPPPASIDIALDKNLLCGFLAGHDFPQPPSVILRPGKLDESELAQLTFPVLFKPAMNAGGIGITSFADVTALLSFLRARQRSEIRGLVQTYIAGNDLDCSVLCRQGSILAHTVQKPLLPRRNPFGSDEAIEFVGEPQALEVTGRVMAALNWSGVAHLDLRWDRQNRQALVLDISPRYWTSLLGSLAAGVNFPYLSCLAALGISFPAPVPVQRDFFTAEAALRHMAARLVRRDAPRLTLRQSGLAYALSDPGPRAFSVAKRMAAVIQAR